MAKPLSSHQWAEIKKDFEGGMSQADIRKKHGIGAGTLGNKIKRDGWRLSQEQTTVLSEFKDASVKISESFHNANDTQKKEMVERIETILQDNEIIENNRKLLKMAQGILVKNRDNFDYTNIRNLTGAVKDMESVSNPQSNKIENNINMQQNNTNNALTMGDLYD